VYTTSAIHARRFSAPRDLDLAGLTFPDTPWLLNRSQADGDPTPDGALGRLYAMGMDSYRLLASLQRLETFPGSRLEGATGRLGLDSLRRVQRRLPWARMGNRGLEVLGYLPEPAGADPTATPLPAAPTGNASGN
jgi:outer membrane PBP1 activator LpoA protein